MTRQFAVDVGGTFTDLVVAEEGRALRLFKAPTSTDDPSSGVLMVFEHAARELATTRHDLLASGSVLVHGTTRAVNAVITGTTARTAFFTSQGHPDILLLREGGRPDPFDHTTAFPEPYVPRTLTFELPGRIDRDGRVREELDEDAVAVALEACASLGVEAIGVCLLWSIVNESHEVRVGELIDRLHPIPYTLSHELTPTLREYRRASTACIDASLKPLMAEYLGKLEMALRSAGFEGELLMMTSSGGVQPPEGVLSAPVLALHSGPAMAPVAAAALTAELGHSDMVVCDTGGTTFDVSVVREGMVARTREAWVGQPFLGHLVGLASVDVESVGAGGGSVAWVDDDGLLHVGPRSAGSWPGPACYGRGGQEATVTDACAVLGLLDADGFLDGAMPLDLDAAARTITNNVGALLSIGTVDAAHEILLLATEHMARAVDDALARRGLDPASLLLVAGGGAAGFNAVAIARRLGCRQVFFPVLAAGLSAAGGLVADLRTELTAYHSTSSATFDHEGTRAVLDRLHDRAGALLERAGGTLVADVVAEARYRDEIWEIDVPVGRYVRGAGVDPLDLVARFHALHERLYAFSEPDAPVDVTAWRIVTTAKDTAVAQANGSGYAPLTAAAHERSTRRVHLGSGLADVPVWRLGEHQIGTGLIGPAIVEAPNTTAFVDEGAGATFFAHGLLVTLVGTAGGAR